MVTNHRGTGATRARSHHLQSHWPTACAAMTIKSTFKQALWVIKWNISLFWNWKFTLIKVRCLLFHMIHFHMHICGRVTRKMHRLLSLSVTADTLQQSLTYWRTKANERCDKSHFFKVSSSKYFFPKYLNLGQEVKW